MTVILARLAATLLVAGTFCYGLSAITGWPGFEQCFWVIVMLLLELAAVMAGSGALVLGAVWLLLSDRSPIPPVRARWTRRLTPIRGAGQTVRSATTSTEGTS
jgi:hypothetical protein